MMQTKIQGFRYLVYFLRVTCVAWRHGNVPSFKNNALTIGIAGDLGALVGLFGHYFRDEVCNPDKDLRRTILQTEERGWKQ